MPRLENSLQTDICVVGGGIAGLLCAYELLQRGRRVILLERGTLSKNETGYTTAHLSDALDDGFSHLLDIHGLDKLRLFYRSHREGIELFESIIKNENIECDFQRVNGYLFSSPDKEASYLDQELEAATKAGVKGVKFSTDFKESFFEMGPALQFQNQAQIHPLKFINGLIKAIIKKGGLIYENTNAISFHETPETYVETEGGFKIECDSIILATNGPTTTNKIYLKQAAYRTYCIALKVRRDSIPHALFWDTSDSYHYMRVTQSSKDSNTDILIVGGEDHRVGEGHPEKAFKNLLTWTQERLGTHISDVATMWSGQLLEPVDGMAFIGKSPGRNHTYIVTGDSGHGFTHSAIASKVIADQIEGSHNEYSGIYDPNRFTPKALKDYVTQNTTTIQHYADWILPHDDIASLLPDEGCVVNDGLKRVAVYKDRDGKLFRMSAVCPHLAGIVKWNSAEKTWDCPCHGSRFDRFGSCLHAPTTHDLQPLGDSSGESNDKDRNIRLGL
ncbi:FAD-dependent oxidoreductase [Bdellovibrio sp. GT3]|uniref:FAD-dependent oxidoreductase n=1 Tax=Bdellovibrio sp. GT3 TaxID=3136282 RepID=UPI0030F40830